MIHVLTCSAPSQVGKVLTFAESCREHCPAATVHWLVADLRNARLLDQLDSGTIGEILFLDDFPELSDRAWLFQHDIAELSRAVVPGAALALLARRGCDQLFYFDSDQVIFSPLDDLVAALSKASVVLTPRILDPDPDDDLGAIEAHEIAVLRHGVFDPGFFGVRDCGEGRAFLQWWSDRCLTFQAAELRSDVPLGQRWVNLAPGFFPGVSILRDPRLSVAPWNVHQREIQGTFDEGFEIGDAPLGFYHFADLDDGSHQRLIDRYAAGNQPVHALAQWFEARSRYLTPAAELTWCLGRYENGEAVLPEHRRIYRGRKDLQAAFPDPYRAGEHGGSLCDWFRDVGPLEYPELLDP